MSLHEYQNEAVNNDRTRNNCFAMRIIACLASVLLVFPSECLLVLPIVFIDPPLRELDKILPLGMIYHPSA